MRALLLAAMYAGCIDSSLTPCGNFACASTQVCSADLTCVSPDQLTACTGASDGAHCTFATSTGFCHHGACVEELGICGDGVTRLALDELCDCGSPDVLAAPPPGCNGFNSDAPGATCRASCKPATCGDGIVDTNELCDDGNTIGGDGCRADCQGRFTKLEVPTGNTLLAVYTLRSDSVYVVGYSDTMLHYDGATWLTLDPGIAGNINGVFAFADDDVYVAGGDLKHYNGVAWSNVDYGATGIAEAVWASSATDIYISSPFAEGTNARHFDGSTWADVVPCAGGISRNITGTGASDVYLATSNGLCHFDGANWSTVDGGDVVYVVQGTPNDVLALSSGFSLRRWTHGVGSPALAIPGDVSAVAQTSAGEILAIGFGGLVLQYAGGHWTHQVTPTELALQAVAATSANDVYIVGSIGTVLH